MCGCIRGNQLHLVPRPLCMSLFVVGEVVALRTHAYTQSSRELCSCLYNIKVGFTKVWRAKCSHSVDAHFSMHNICRIACILHTYTSPATFIRTHTCTLTRHTAQMFRMGFDFLRTSKSGTETFIRKLLTEEEREKNSKKARLRRELAAMKARDKVSDWLMLVCTYVPLVWTCSCTYKNVCDLCDNAYTRNSTERAGL